MVQTGNHGKPLAPDFGREDGRGDTLALSLSNDLLQVIPDIETGYPARKISFARSIDERTNGNPQ